MAIRRPRFRKTAISDHAVGDLQADFLGEMATNQPVRALFDYLDDTYFFIKDHSGRFVTVSRPLLARFGYADERQMLGSTDADRYPPAIAARYRADDEAVMRRGDALIRRVEMLYDDVGLLSWFVTTKLPVRNRAGCVIGVMGIVRPWREERAPDVPTEHMRHVLNAIRADSQCTLTVSDLAAACGISERQLHRICLSAFATTAKELLTRSRLQRAAEALKTSNEPIARIAVACGFCDQSAFSKRFVAFLGVTPARFRKRFGGG